jgi:hypothetical protein
VAPFAGGKIIAAKGAFAVMTGNTTLAASSRMMIQWLRRGDLSSLRHSCSYLMTFIAIYFLVLCMVKADPEGRRKFRRPRIATQLMAGTARRNVTSAGLRPRSMTSIAGGMRVEPRRDR